MNKVCLVFLLIFCLFLEGCAYELGYALGTANRYAGSAVRV